MINNYATTTSVLDFINRIINFLETYTCFIEEAIRMTLLSILVFSLGAQYLI